MRAEYDARIKTFRDCLPETRRNRDRLGIYRNDEQLLRAADDSASRGTQSKVAGVRAASADSIVYIPAPSSRSSKEARSSQ